MATYKVIQDIEAEDKLIGPLSLRQFIYAIIVIVTGFIAFQLFRLFPLLAIPLVPIMIFFGLLAAPLGGAQSSEVWLLAKIRFNLKPRRRIWNQSGVQELVTITAPKKIEKILTDNLSQTEVKSRLEALANTIDSRGWVVKNVSTNLYAQPGYAMAADSTDRLIDASTLPQEVPTFDDKTVVDMLDDQSNPLTAHLDQMMHSSAEQHRTEIVQKMQSPASPATQSQSQDLWFLNQPDPSNIPQNYAAFGASQPVTPHAVPVQAASNTPVTADEKALLDKIRSDHKKPDPTHSHLKTIQPLSAQAVQPQNPDTTPPQSPATTPVTPAPDPAILGLANNDDLNVATIARQAEKSRQQHSSDDEVVVSLH